MSARRRRRRADRVVPEIGLPPEARAVEDEQMRRDRAYFVLRPDAQSYVRRWIPGEFYPMDASALGVLDDPVLAERIRECMVEVVQLHPGYRQRLPLFAIEKVVRELAAARGIELPDSLVPPGVAGTIGGVT